MLNARIVMSASSCPPIAESWLRGRLGNLAGLVAVEAFFFEGMSQFLDLELFAMDKPRKDSDENTKFQLQMVRALGHLREPKQLTGSLAVLADYRRCVDSISTSVNMFINSSKQA